MLWFLCIAHSLANSVVVLLVIAYILGSKSPRQTRLMHYIQCCCEPFDPVNRLGITFISRESDVYTVLVQ